MKKRNAFTLVELVVVIMILGILAGVAAPKLLSTSGQANTAAVRQTLSVVRDAIELYAAQNGGSPPADPSTDLELYLRGDFPASPVGTGDSSVTVVSAGTDLSSGAAGDWRYDSSTGEFISDTTGYDSY